MTSTGPDHAHTGNTGTTGASASSAGSSASRSTRRRRRQVHRRAAPPSARSLDKNRSADSTGQGTYRDADHRNAENSPATRSSQRPARTPKTFHGDLPDATAAPFVSLTVATSGIHPTTSRLVAIAAVLYDAEGKVVAFTGNRPASSSTASEAGSSNGWGIPDSNTTDTTDADGNSSSTGGAPSAIELTGVVQQINPGEDPGPWHLHGYTEAELGQAPGFTTVAPLLFTLINGRTVICHRTSLAWGFIVQEYRRAQRTAQRNAAQGGNRGRRRNQRRPRKFAVPVPERIVEILGTARRQSVPVIDPRLRSIAGHYRNAEGLNLAPDTLPELGAVASVTRADTGADELLLADTRILMPLHLVQEDLADAGRGIIQSAVPEDLIADRFGLQRSTIRVDATTSPRPLENPGVPSSTAVGALTEGMEFVISPDVATNPDELIAAGLRAGLVYSEKLNRTSSLVVCNRNYDLRGKAMHAHRKNIPLFTDAEFLAALEDVGEGTAATGKPETRPATPRIPAPQRGGQNRSRQGSKRAQGNRQGRRQNPQQGAKKGAQQGATRGNRQGGNTGNTGHSASQQQNRASDPENAQSPGATGPTSRDGSGTNQNRSRSRNRHRSRNRQPNSQKQQGQHKQQNKDVSTNPQPHSGTGRPEGTGNSSDSRSSQRSHRSGARRRRRSGDNRHRSGGGNGPNNASGSANSDQPQKKG